MVKNAPYDFPELFQDFAMMPKFGENVETLAQMAEPEDWDYKNSISQHPHPILRNYLTYTYRRVAEEKKISITTDEAHACWNTGLITGAQEPIFMLLSKNMLSGPQSYWHFLKFARKGEWEMNRFPSLPDIAHYFEDPSALVLDTRKELRVNVEHVVSENLPRFPATLQCRSSFELQNQLRARLTPQNNV